MLQAEFCSTCVHAPFGLTPETHILRTAAWKRVPNCIYYWMGRLPAPAQQARATLADLPQQVRSHEVPHTAGASMQKRQQAFTTIRVLSFDPRFSYSALEV